MNPIRLPHLQFNRINLSAKYHLTIFTFILLSSFLHIACTPRPASSNNNLTIFAAASLTNAFTELAQAFEAQHPDTIITLNFAGSSQLAAQLREGATADLFASANPAQIEVLITAGQIPPQTAVPFATNQLTLITPIENPANITQFTDLAQTDLTLLTASPGVPIRLYTDQLIAQQPANFQTNYYENILSEEDNVRQIVAKIALGEADGGIVYYSDITPDLATKLQQISIPNSNNITPIYPISILNDAPQPELAQIFIDFILSPEGQEILNGWGFSPPPSNQASP